MEQWQSEQITDLMKALNSAQLNMMPAKKDKQNPFFHSKYADLNTVWDALLPFREAGIVFTQAPMEGLPGCITLDTQLTHAETGQWIRGRLTLPLAKTDPQGAGSAITYARRYSLGCMTGLVTEEDDDANAASHAPAKPIPQAAINRTMATIHHKEPLDSVEMHNQPEPDRPVWTVPDDISWAKKLAGLMPEQLKDNEIKVFVEHYQSLLAKYTGSKQRSKWEEAILDLEVEITLRRDGVVMRP